MRKIGLFAGAAALSVVAVAGWVGTITHARLDGVNNVRIDPIAIMADANALPEQHVVDFSLVYE
ncbi:MAG TPA: hypothetical protein VKD43_15450 [Xanthobacteraceae bacterium]|jgi:hypothetical protein|nr:hypothetical protein [Xanthobacteraceae bacterium]